MEQAYQSPTDKLLSRAEEAWLVAVDSGCMHLHEDRLPLATLLDVRAKFLPEGFNDALSAHEPSLALPISPPAVSADAKGSRLVDVSSGCGS